MQTVESVTMGHPDKICDQISDAILDEYLRRDPDSRVAVETFGGHGLLFIGGEVTSQASFDVAQLALSVYRDIGYRDELEPFVNIEAQAPEIGRGVDRGGAGDQGIMYGYATVETLEFLPKIIVVAKSITKRLADLRLNHQDFYWLGPDGKSQVTMQGGEIKKIVVSTQHIEEVGIEEVRSRILEHVVKPLAGSIEGADIFINPAGSFVQAGFSADTGLTGRKIMVDTYGGILPSGGGAFSGKDATKVDRSAAYMARFAAKNIVAAGHAKNCLVSVAYAIGQPEPVMLEARDAKGRDLTALVREKFDFRPQAIIERLDLRRPIFRDTAAHGHFGREGLPWEEIINL
ncbi:methionine adenosyltransferase [Patescibacteria group bacterium]|nr:methionine adenosyltransferase [Patescibacteria group bacterium]MBU1922537.1 methionine adenosyltransferase [Patescibacteria group bacterium]